MSTLTSVSGFPRIGQNRELKKIIEGYWKGANDLAAVKATAAELRAKHWKLQQAAGIDLIPSNDFSYYDQMLDTAILLNVIPQRYARLSFDNQEDTLFAMARGYQGDKGDVTALPMKKWFTTNYHYLVPEVESAAEIKLNSTKPFDEFNEAKALGIDTKPVFIGPYTFLKLARTPEATELELDKGLVNAVAAVYAEVLAKFNELGAAWVQLDEPYLVLDKEPGDVELFKTLYTKILSAKGNVKVLLNTYFGHIADVYETVNLLGFDGIGLDLNEGREENLEAVAKYGVASNTTIFAGVINGRNIWRNNYATSLGLVDALKQVTANVAVSTASSLLHVPFSTEGETGIPAEDLKHFAFAVQKLDELRKSPPWPTPPRTRRRHPPPSPPTRLCSTAPAWPPTRPSPSASASCPTPTTCVSLPRSVRPCSARPSACRCCRPPPSAPSPRPRRFAPSVPSCARARSPRKPTTSSSKPRSTPSSRSRRRSASTCWSTASSSVTTWSNTSARTSTASCSPRTPGSSPTAPVASSPRSSGATFPAPTRLPWNGPRTPSPRPTM